MVRAVSADNHVQRLRELLNEICIDSLEIALDRIVANREYFQTQEISALFLEANDVLDILEGRIENLDWYLNATTKEVRNEQT